jgi:type II secretory pathway pseudopilin PulG
MTLLEVVLAIAMLALIGASMLGAIGAIDTMQVRGRMQLGAYEIANRLLLQYMHDERKLPNKTLTLDYGPFRYFYDIEVERVKMDLNAVQGSGESVPQGLDRYEHVTITLFQAEGGEEAPSRGDQVAQIVRILDPFAPRNPETLASYKSDPTRVNQLIGKLNLGSGGNQPPPPPRNP